MSTADELAKLDALRQQGVLSEAEFAAAKARLLGPPTPSRPAPSKTVAQPNRPTKKPKKKMTRRIFFGLFLVVIVIVVVVASSGSSGPSAHVTGKVTSVVALDSNTVRIYILWSNTGKAAGSASCAMNTSVYNQFGDQVNIEVNSTATNGNVKAGATQFLYQDIGVNNGDAQYIKPSDVTILDC